MARKRTTKRLGKNELEGGRIISSFKTPGAIKAIRDIRRQMKDSFSVQHLQYRIAPTVVSQPYAYFNLCNYNTMRSIFGTSGGDYSTTNKWHLLNMNIELIFDQNNEAADVDMTCYLVTLKKEAVAYYNSTTGVLNTLTAGVDYADNDNAGNASTSILNPFLFTVHKKKRFAIGNNNVASLAATGIAGTTYVANRKRFTWKVKCNKEMRNPAGSMSTLTASQDPRSQYYIIVFNNNSSVDLENPTVEINAINKIRVPN